MLAPRPGRPVVSSKWLRLPSLGLVLIGAAHCGAEEASPTAATEPAPAPIRLVDEELSLENSHAPDSQLVGKCVVDSLITDANGVPDCVLLVARKLSDAPPAASAAACERCDWPGQRVPTAATLARARLPRTETGCLCEMVGQPPPADGDLEKADFGFCYLRARDEADPSPLIRHCPEKATLGMRGGSLEPMPFTMTIVCY